MLPNNAVEYFVSYYDYYQPEAYIPQTDTYIEKDSSINDEVERLRHSATNSLLTRRDAIVVASVSCIYGLGTPQEYVDRMVRLKVGDSIDRDALLRKLVGMQYTRNDLAFTRGTFRVRGDTIEIIPHVRGARRPDRDVRRRDRAADDAAPADRRGDHRGRRSSTSSRPPTTWPVRSGWSAPSPASRPSWPSGSAELERQGKLLEAQRLRMRTTYDIEMMRQVGCCSGIENYSRHIDGREAGQRRRTPCSTTSPRTSCWSSTSRTRPCRRSARCTRATRPASGCWSTTASGCRARMDNRPLTLGGVRRADRPDRLPVGHPGPVRAAAGRRRRGRAGDPADRPGRPARSSSSRPRARSTTCCTRSGCGPSATSGCWSPR